ncbi:hypothetical protein [Micromonospora sp. NPDC049891]|uniref:hypothetical protein n=1 Tax=Micromonospora sp. NPDC049891 TaxID=3155655 RepID=UPI00340C1F6B
MGQMLRKLSTRPDPDTTSPGRNRPGQPRIITCRYLNTSGNQCSGEALDETADVVLCGRHTALVVEHFNAAARRHLGDDLDRVNAQVDNLNTALTAATTGSNQ